MAIFDRVTTDPLAALKSKTSSNACGGVCQNGGQCQNGECNCREGFAGQFCDEEEEGIAAELIWFFIITAIILVAIVLLVKANKLKMPGVGGGAGADPQ